MDDEIDLRQYLAVLWRKRYTIGAVSLAAIVAAGLFSFLSPPVYEAKAMVLVTKSSFQVGTPPDPGSRAIGAVLASELRTETLVAFAQSATIMQRVGEKVSGGAARDRRLAGRLTALVIRNTNLVELRARGSDPDRVAKIANQWAAVVTAESEAVFSTEAQQSYAFFDGRLNEAKGRLETEEEVLQKFSASSKLGVLQARLNAVTGQIAAYQSRLTDLSVALQKSETELAQVETQIRRQPRTLTLSKSITTDPFLHQAASEAANRDFVELSKLKLKTEELNPVYINLDQARANLSIQAAGLRAERAKVTEAIGQLNDELNQLRGQLAVQQLLQTRLVRSVDNARSVYEVLLTRREEARVASASQTGSAKLVAEAVVPDAPVAPRKMFNLTLGAVLGLMIGTILAFAMGHFSSPAPAPVSRPVAAIAPDPARGKEVGA